MAEWRIAPTARRTEVSGGDYDGAGEAPFWVAHTFDLKTSPTTQPIVVQGCTQRRRFDPIVLAVYIAISTSPTYNNLILKNVKLIKKNTFKFF